MPLAPSIVEYCKLRKRYKFSHPKCRALESRIVAENMGLVNKQLSRFNGPLLSDDELRQEGSIGLLKAIRQFDASKGFAFSSFAVAKIRGEIQHALRRKRCTSNKAKVVRGKFDLWEKVSSVSRKIQQADIDAIALCFINKSFDKDLYLAAVSAHRSSEFSAGLVQSVQNLRSEGYDIDLPDWLQLKAAMSVSPDEEIDDRVMGSDDSGTSEWLECTIARLDLTTGIVFNMVCLQNAEIPAVAKVLKRSEADVKRLAQCAIECAKAEYQRIEGFSA